jgi:hypothetical protein
VLHGPLPFVTVGNSKHVHFRRTISPNFVTVGCVTTLSTDFASQGILFDHILGVSHSY